jgi:hypothetical protein
MAAVPPVLGNLAAPPTAPQPSGQVAPQDSPNNQQQPYGLNNMWLEDGNEQLGIKGRPELVEAIRSMVTDYRAEGIVARRHEIRRIRQARMFYQGLQYAWWDNNQEMWVVPFTSRLFDDKDQEEQPRYMYVTNFYLGYALAFIAVISSDVPNVRCRPAKASKIEDVRAAESATNVISVIEENNKPFETLEDVGMYLFTDGKIGAYVRFVSDAEQFGVSEEPIITSQYKAMGPDMYSCPNCGAQSTEDQVVATGMLSCPQCGTQLGPKDLKKAPRMNVPTQSGTKEVPNGQEVISIVGGLELNTPVWARKMVQFPYLQWQMEVHRAQLKASFPHIEDKIQMGGSQSADEVYARTSRLTVSQGLPAVVPGDTLYDLVTYSQTWIRKSSFFRLEDKEMRAELLKLFPHGCYVAFAGDTYCISRDEKMDDKWRVMHAYPGDGQNRPSVGDPLIELQERYNTLSNIAMEMYEMGLGAHFADPEVINFDAISNTTVEPGAWYPAKARAGKTLAESFYDQQNQDVPTSLPQYAEELSGEISQFVTGLFPAVFGGEAKGAGGETKGGYELSRDQAMGRIGLVWRRLKEFYADIMMLGVKCFAENRPTDVEISVEGIDGKDEPDYIRLTDLKGNIKVTAEGDENFPRMTSQKKAALSQMFATFGKDTAFLEMMDQPANLEFARDVNGLTELQLPGVDAARNQKVETKTLLQSGPEMMPGPDGKPQPQSTVKVDPLLDDHDAHLEEIQRLAESEDGQKIKRNNQNGWSNLRQHAIEHIKGKAAKAAMMAAMSGPLPGAPAPQVPAEATA